MREKDLDIVELIIKNMPEENELQSRIKLYMQMHKTNCNNFIYTKYEKETLFFNTILKSLMSDLSSEILRTFQQKYNLEGGKDESINII
jgi:hypothetical protein